MSRMSISNIKSTRQHDRPLRIALYGTPGIGKSTFASQAPSPVFLCTEDGAGFLDAQAFDRPACWQDVMDAVESLLRDPHDRKTLVIDTLDALESLCWEHVCKTFGTGKTRSIEDFGYGKGYQHAVETWGSLLRLLERLQTERKMHLVLIAHAVPRDHKDPDHESWKRWSMKLHSKSADLIAGWVDALLFAAPEMVAKKDGLKTRGFATGERLLYTQSAGAHEAKNRYGLPVVMALDWPAFFAAARAAQPDPEAIERETRRLLTDINTLIPQLPMDRQDTARAAVTKAKTNEQLAKILNHINSILSA